MLRIILNVCLCLALLGEGVLGQQASDNQVLVLGGGKDYVELPSQIIGPLNETTVECWVWWDDFPYYGQPWGFGEQDRSDVLAINTYSNRRDFQYFRYRDHQIDFGKLAGFVVGHQWYHFAVSVGEAGMRLMCNGVVVHESLLPGGVASILNDTANYLGRSQWESNAYFKGRLDEVRVWDHVLSVDQVRFRLFQRLKGDEAGLVACWSFDSGDGRDSSTAGRDAWLRGDASCVVESLPRSFAELPQPNILSGLVTDGAGTPLVGATVRAFCGLESLRQVTTNESGRYRLEFVSPCGPFDVSYEWRELGGWRMGLDLSPGLNPNIDCRLERNRSASGVTLALDNAPQGGVSVQALGRFSKDEPFDVVQIVQSDDTGHFSFFNLRPGEYIFRCHSREGFVYYQSQSIPPQSVPVSTGKAVELVQASRHVFEKSIPIERIDLRFSLADIGRWRNFGYLDGLGSSSVHSILEASDGAMWFGTAQGVVRYDGRSFTLLDAPGAPRKLVIRSMAEFPEGTLWFATERGLFRYDESGFKQFTEADGLPRVNTFFVTLLDDKELWCGAEGGVRVFDGERFQLVPSEPLQFELSVTYIERLPNQGVVLLTDQGPVAKNQTSNRVQGIWEANTLIDRRVDVALVASDSFVWFGTPVGLSKYRWDGTMIHKERDYTVRDGLSDASITAAVNDSDGSIWFGSKNGGLTRFSEQGASTINVLRGLGADRVSALCLQSNDNLWVGTIGGGLSLLERATPTNYGRSHGLGARQVLAIEGDQAGNLWLGLEGGGLGFFDGRGFQNYQLLDEHGLPHDNITSIGIGEDDSVWVGADDGTLGRLVDRELVPLSGVDPRRLERVNAFQFFREGECWLGTDSGLHRLLLRSEQAPDSGETGVRTTLAETVLDSTSVLDLEVGEVGELWIATRNQGVFRMSGEELVRFDASDGLPNAPINDVYVSSEGKVWCSSEEGVYEFMGGRFHSLSEIEILRDAPCNGMTQTSDGKLWIATASAGLGVFDGTHWNTLDMQDGLAGNSISQVYPAPDGSLWLCTDGGLSHYQPSEIPPTLRIENVHFDSPVAQPERDLAARTGSRVRFGFHSIDFKTSAAKRQYRGRVTPIEGNRDVPFQTIRNLETFEWSSSTPGRYRFEVQAIDRDLNVSSSEFVDFAVIDPWYLRRVFLVPIVGMGGVVLLTVVFLALRLISARREARALGAQLLDQEREKNSALSDANARIEAQKEGLRQASQAKSVFLAHMSHEIRTPLHTVMGYAGLLRKNPDLPPKQKMSAEIIERSGKHLLTLVNEVLDLSKIEAGKAKYEESEFNLWDCIQALDAMFRLQCEQKGLDWQIRWELPERNHLLVLGDEQKFRQILINLLNNAVKFTESGHIVLSVTPETPDDLRGRDAALESDKLRIRFSVSDSGVGIEPEEQTLILEPFQRGRSSDLAGGTGLGLSIAGRLVETLGGSLQLESSVGKGSTFFFVLSLALGKEHTDQWESGVGVESSQLTRMDNISAVVADDNFVNRELLENILARLGVTATLAENGREAVDAVNRTQPDIVFLDVHMPLVDGITACRTIREGPGKNGREPVRLVAVSAAAFQQDQDNCLAAGFDEFLAKPFTNEQVEACLARLLPQSCVFESSAGDNETGSADWLTGEELKELCEAAEIGSVGDIDRITQEVVEREKKMPLEIREIRERCQRFDFAGIRQVLDRLTSK